MNQNNYLDACFSRTITSMRTIYIQGQKDLCLVHSSSFFPLIHYLTLIIL